MHAIYRIPKTFNTSKSSCTEIFQAFQIAVSDRRDQDRYPPHGNHRKSRGNDDDDDDVVFI